MNLNEARNLLREIEAKKSMTEIQRGAVVGLRWTNETTAAAFLRVSEMPTNPTWNVLSASVAELRHHIAARALSAETDFHDAVAVDDFWIELGAPDEPEALGDFLAGFMHAVLSVRKRVEIARVR